MFFNVKSKDKLILKDKAVTAKVAFQTIHGWLLENYPEYAEACRILDYGIPSSMNRDVLMFTRETIDWLPRPIVIVDTGGSEGVYVDWDLKLDPPKEQNPTMFRVGTLKTLDESPEAYGKMGLIAGYLVFATDLFVIQNL